MKVKTKALHSKAYFSDCGRYRYQLFRRYRPVSERFINFLMLNPSTADAEWNDNTVAKCERIALAHGYTDMVITNLFAYRATDPSDMMQAHSREGVDVIGPENDLTICITASLCEVVVCAWGNHGGYAGRSTQVRELLHGHTYKLRHLALNQSLEPKHPLYVRDDALLNRWDGGRARP